MLPSRYEGYSLVTQEAIACGIPAFVTSTAGIASRFPSELKRFLLHDPNDIEDLALRLREWRSRVAEFRSAVAPFSEELRNHSWDGMAGQMLEKIEA